MTTSVEAGARHTAPVAEATGAGIARARSPRTVHTMTRAAELILMPPVDITGRSAALVALMARQVTDSNARFSTRYSCQEAVQISRRTTRRPMSEDQRLFIEAALIRYLCEKYGLANVRAAAPPECHRPRSTRRSTRPAGVLTSHPTRLRRPTSGAAPGASSTRTGLSARPPGDVPTGSPRPAVGCGEPAPANRLATACLVTPRHSPITRHGTPDERADRTASSAMTATRVLNSRTAAKRVTASVAPSTADARSVNDCCLSSSVVVTARTVLGSPIRAIAARLRTLRPRATDAVRRLRCAAVGAPHVAAKRTGATGARCRSKTMRQKRDAIALAAVGQAATVPTMTNTCESQPVTAGSTCRCGHSHDEHVLALVIQAPPSGVMLCQEPDCPCSSTWRAGTRRSTPAEIEATRREVRAELVRAGLPLPGCLL